MVFRTYTPCESLLDIVSCYWTVDLPSAEDQHSERVYATGGITILFHYGTPFCELQPDGTGKLQERSLVCGQSLTFSDVLALPGSGMIGAVLYPYGLKALSSIPMKILTGRDVRFGDLFPEFRDIDARIGEAPDTRARIQLLDRTFMALRRQERGRHYENVREAARQIEQSRGLISESLLLDNLEMNERTLQRAFSEYIGLSPHEFILLRRINHAIGMLGRTASLTELAHESEFYDQAHFIKSFKSLTGYTPGEYRKILLPFK
jgi:AraC-like DNA-binding protein